MIASKPRCTHFCPCPCPLLPEYSQRPRRGDEWSPEWGLWPVNDEDPNKALAEKIKRQRLTYMLSHLTVPFKNLFVDIKRHSEMIPKVRSFRWLVSSYHVPEGYQDGRAPWRMLVRTYFKDLPRQLRQEDDIRSIKLWRTIPLRKGPVIDHTEHDKAPSKMTCCRRDFISLYWNDKYRTLGGDWLIVVYLWADDRIWAKNTCVKDLISFSSVTGIRAWEWVKPVDSRSKTPYLFYELERDMEGTLKDTVFGGNAYKDYDPVPIQPGDPVPTRLSGLRRLMNEQARQLLYADYEF
ncbi:hypothetical protein J3E69DRAFT_376325 [Trichoderma sp. SZMC 28015]